MKFSFIIFNLAGFIIDNFTFSLRWKDIITIIGKLIGEFHFIGEFNGLGCSKPSFNFQLSDDDLFIMDFTFTFIATHYWTNSINTIVILFINCSKHNFIFEGYLSAHYSLFPYF